LKNKNTIRSVQELIYHYPYGCQLALNVSNKITTGSRQAQKNKTKKTLLGKSAEIN